MIEPKTTLSRGILPLLKLTEKICLPTMATYANFATVF
jgi:hypothetical protein